MHAPTMCTVLGKLHPIQTEVRLETLDTNTETTNLHFGPSYGHAVDRSVDRSTFCVPEYRWQIFTAVFHCSHPNTIDLTCPIECSFQNSYSRP